MKIFNFVIFLGDKKVINMDINARDEKEAVIIVKRHYPPAKGFKYELINNVSD